MIVRVQDISLSGVAYTPTDSQARRTKFTNVSKQNTMLSTGHKTILTPAVTSNHPRPRRPTTTTAVTVNTAATVAATVHFLSSALLAPAPPPALSPGSSLKKALAPPPPEAADFVAADAPTPPGTPDAVPKLTSLLLRDMLRDARERFRLGVRGPSSVGGKEEGAHAAGRTAERNGKRIVEKL